MKARMMKTCAWHMMLAFSVLLSLLLFSCQREEPEMSFDATSFDLPADGGTVRVNLTTNYGWKANVSDPWIVVTPTSAKKGTTTVKIDVAANDKPTARKGSISFDCHEMIRGVAITQMPLFEQSLVIKHQSTNFTVPTFTGSSFAGVVNWGDGKEETYKAGISHDYGQMSGSPMFTVEIKSTGGYSFSLKSVAGISEIDFQNF